jgi:hypothetical protein
LLPPSDHSFRLVPAEGASLSSFTTIIISVSAGKLPRVAGAP